MRSAFAYFAAVAGLATLCPAVVQGQPATLAGRMFKITVILADVSSFALIENERLLTNTQNANSVTSMYFFFLFFRALLRKQKTEDGKDTLLI